MISAIQPMMRVRGLNKVFSGVTVLHNVSFDLYPGTILGVAGENGAGKSTLFKTLSGIYRPDGGEITLDASTVNIASPHMAE